MEYSIKGRNGVTFGKKTSNCECVDITLEKGETFTLSGDQRDILIQVGQGSLWITQEDDPRDYRLEESESFQVSCSGMVVLQGLPAAQFRLIPVEASRLYALDQQEKISV